MQATLVIETLPQSAIEAANLFHRDWIDRVCEALDEETTSALAIVMPPAPSDHRDWRLAIARDLARAYTPRRVNIVAGRRSDALTATLNYLANAPGVTGQYCLLHEA